MGKNHFKLSVKKTAFQNFIFQVSSFFFFSFHNEAKSQNAIGIYTM
jgi:hypothetical protein